MNGLVNLMGAACPTERDIVNWMESRIAEHYPQAEQTIITRKLVGAATGFYELDDAERAEVADYAGVCRQVQLDGRAERARAALLRRVLAHEASEQSLAEDDAEGLQLLEQRATARAPITTEGGSDG